MKDIKVIKDEDNTFIAFYEDLPLYGYGESKVKAMIALRDQLKCCYKEIKNSPITEEWERYREIIKARLTVPKVEPIYDDIYFEGVAYLDAIARGDIDDGDFGYATWSKGFKNKG